MTPYYEQSGVTIYHGDCREWFHTTAPKRVDHVITDPPYARDVYLRMGAPNTKTGSGTHARMNIPASGKQGRPIHDLRDGSLAKMAAGDIGSIDGMLERVAESIARLVRRWAVVFSDVETTHRWRSALELHGLRYVRTGAWVKPDAMPQMSGDRPAVGFEPATICHAQGAMRWNGGGRPAVWIYNTAKGASRPDHPCPKPEQLMGELICLFTDPGELILDPFMGSGTTLVEAKRFARKAIGVEVDERYCEIAARRLQQESLFSDGELTGDDASREAAKRMSVRGPSPEPYGPDPCDNDCDWADGGHTKW